MRVVFIDLAKAAANGAVRRQLDAQVSHSYFSDLVVAFEFLSEHSVDCVLLSCANPTDELAERCALIEHANPETRLPIILLLDNERGIERVRSFPGVEGVATLETSWQSTIWRLSSLVDLVVRTRHLEQRLAIAKLASSAYGVLSCSIRCDTGRCTAESAFFRAFDLYSDGIQDPIATESSGIHWKRLLASVAVSDRERLSSCVEEAMRSGQSWSINCTLRQSSNRFDCRGFATLDTHGEPAEINIFWRFANPINLDLTVAPHGGSNLSNSLVDHIRGREMGSILLVRLENYAYILKSLGYGTCKNVAAAVVSRIQTAVRSSDLIVEAAAPGDNIVCIEGSEIVVILDDLPDSDALASVQQRVTQALRAPIRSGERNVPVRCTIGKASWPIDGVAADDLLDAASFVLDAQAGDGDSGAPGTDKAREAFEVEADLYGAISRQELVLHFQPKYSLGKTASPVGAEALLRWHRNRSEWIPPDVFIPMAEESGLILEIGRWVIEETTRHQRKWLDDGVGLVNISVNVSAEQFKQPDFLDHLRESCLGNRIPYAAIELELTESCLIDDAAGVYSILAQAKQDGFSIALDDFGTGFSSLSYLRTLPLDVLKIDQSFVRSLDGESYDPSLTAAIIGIGLVLGLRIVAEGIETADQWRMLSDWGCHLGQGYLMSRPVPGDVLAELMQQEFAVAASA